MINCKICNREFGSMRGLSLHINHSHHQLTNRQYYDIYLKKNPNACLICEKETKYISLSSGYQTYCSYECLYKSMKGRPSAFKGKHHTDEAKKKSSDAKKGHIPWSKGKTGVFSEESLRKMRENHVSHDQSGCKNHMYGKKQTPESNEKRSKSLMGRTVSEYARNQVRLSRLGKKSSDKTKKLISLNHADVSKDKNPNWRDGSSFLPYCHKFNKQLKNKIRERDNKTCQLCATPENGHKHGIHHIHYDKENCNPDLITLCRGCNAKVNFNRDYYESLFMNKLNERGLLFWTQHNNKDGVNNG